MLINQQDFFALLSLNRYVVRICFMIYSLMSVKVHNASPVGSVFVMRSQTYATKFTFITIRDHRYYTGMQCVT